MRRGYLARKHSEAEIKKPWCMPLPAIAFCTITNNMATPKLSLKLLIDNNSKKVLYAEASKDAVDFLFSLLALPLGSIVKLLTKQNMVGCIGSLYESIETLDETYMQSNQGKTTLLNPTTASPNKNTLFLIEESSTTTAKRYYRCTRGYYECPSYYTDVHGTRCPGCNDQMVTEMRYAVPNSEAVAAAIAKKASAGFVKGVVTYTVMDDLSVKPMSTISSITMLNKFNVKDVGSLEERTVNLGSNEGLELLRGSLQSKTVLTDVFMSNAMEGSGVDPCNASLFNLSGLGDLLDDFTQSCEADVPTLPTQFARRHALVRDRRRKK